MGTKLKDSPLLKRLEEDRAEHSRSYEIKAKADQGTSLQTEKCQGFPVTTKMWEETGKDSDLQPSQSNQPCLTLISGFYPPEE